MDHQLVAQAAPKKKSRSATSQPPVVQSTTYPALGSEHKIGNQVVQRLRKKT